MLLPICQKEIVDDVGINTIQFEPVFDSAPPSKNCPKLWLFQFGILVVVPEIGAMYSQAQLYAGTFAIKNKGLLGVHPEIVRAAFLVGVKLVKSFHVTPTSSKPPIRLLNEFNVLEISGFTPPHKI